MPTSEGWAWHPQKMAATKSSPRTIFRKQCQRRNVAGHCHFLTFSCYRRQPFLASRKTCLWLAAAINDACRFHGFSLYAYVFMPDHVHLLLHPHRHNYSISNFLTSVKRPVTYEAKKFLMTREFAGDHVERFLDIQPNGQYHFRFWQRGGGYDRNIWSDEEFEEKRSYIHGNPVKRGLCETPTEWQWSSAAYYAEHASGPVNVIINQGND